MIQEKPTFTRVEQTIEEITKRLLFRPNLQKLLFYSDRHCLGMNNLNQDQVKSLVGNQLKVVPRLEIDAQGLAYIIISFEGIRAPYLEIPTNRDIDLGIAILCNYSYWQLDDFKLRPYSIAGEIDAALNTTTLDSGGIAQFIQADQMVFNEVLGGAVLHYLIRTDNQ